MSNSVLKCTWKFFSHVLANPVRCMCVCMYVCMCVCMYVCLSVCLSVPLSDWICLPLSRPFFLVPSTYKRLLRRLVICMHDLWTEFSTCLERRLLKRRIIVSLCVLAIRTYAWVELNCGKCCTIYAWRRSTITFDVCPGLTPSNKTGLGIRFQ